MRKERMTEREKKDLGLWYDANYDPKLLEERMQAEDLCFAFNHTAPRETEKQNRILEKLLAQHGKDSAILAPFNVDYGYNCRIGDHTFVNHYAYFMDCAPITIGKFCFIGPYCGMYTAIHPLVSEERNQGLEIAKPITVGDNVWIGANVTVLPGVTIGEGSVIGAKSVVTKDIPANVLAMGNPCRVIRAITEADRIQMKKE